jgi:glycosyltransferase involved in cell wall biosynthesis
MLTNTFTPHVGGVARSVEQFSHEYRVRGHHVLVVAPEFPDTPARETDVVRVPAVQQFNGSDFSIPMPIPGLLTPVLQEFQPHIVHSHHPFLLGDTALRIASTWDTPLVFTHHTQYERYTHYVPGDSEAMKRFVLELVTGYCNLCDVTIAPSATIAQRLRDQGVNCEIVEIPTGVDVQLFGAGDGLALRRRLGITESEFVVGHVGRLAPEKGLDFLAAAVAAFVRQTENARFVVAGTGPSADAIRDQFAALGVSERLTFLGSLERPELADVYAAMNVFAFASQSETQGMVLTESMAAGTPVVAVDAPGVREVLRDGVNGRMVPSEDQQTFVDALRWCWQAADAQRAALRVGARQTADEFSLPRTAEKALQLYQRLIERGRRGPHGDDLWSLAQRRFADEWNLWSNLAEAASRALWGEDKSAT